MTEWSVSHETIKKTSSQRMWLACIGDVVSTKIAHHPNGCGWLASRRGSKYKKNNTSSQRMWLAYKEEIVRMIV